MPQVTPSEMLWPANTIEPGCVVRLGRLSLSNLERLAVLLVLRVPLLNDVVDLRGLPICASHLSTLDLSSIAVYFYITIVLLVVYRKVPL